MFNSRSKNETYARMLSGANVLIVGESGSGKTFIVTKFRDQWKDMKNIVYVPYGAGPSDEELSKAEILIFDETTRTVPKDYKGQVIRTSQDARSLEWCHISSRY